MQQLFNKWLKYIRCREANKFNEFLYHHLAVDCELILHLTLNLSHQVKNFEKIHGNHEWKILWIESSALNINLNFRLLFNLPSYRELRPLLHALFLSPKCSHWRIHQRCRDRQRTQVRVQRRQFFVASWVLQESDKPKHLIDI